MKVWQVVGVVALIALAGRKVYTVTRGPRNNNPGKLRRTSDAWKGLRDDQTDPEFFQFDGAEWGIRALGIVLWNYDNLYGLNTVRGIVGKYAPSGENDTDAYIKYVSDSLGVSPDERVDVDGRLLEIVKAVIRFENGINPYSDKFIASALNIA
jgi:hypothetical protein